LETAATGVDPTPYPLLVRRRQPLEEREFLRHATPLNAIHALKAELTDTRSMKSGVGCLMNKQDRDRHRWAPYGGGLAEVASSVCWDIHRQPSAERTHNHARQVVLEPAEAPWVKLADQFECCFYGTEGNGWIDDSGVDPNLEVANATGRRLGPLAVVEP
jgi:hypothetical protein